MIDSTLRRPVPVARAFSPETGRFAPLPTAITAFVPPGSERTTDPEGIFNHLTYALPRSNMGAKLASEKW
jgi:hypothetical protein